MPPNPPGTLSDFLKADLSTKYPDLMPFVRVTLLQSAQSILTTVGGLVCGVWGAAAESAQCILTTMGLGLGPWWGWGRGVRAHVHRPARAAWLSLPVHRLPAALANPCAPSPPQFSAPLQAQAIRNFEAAGIDVRLGVRVTAVRARGVEVGWGQGLHTACKCRTRSHAMPQLTLFGFRPPLWLPPPPPPRWSAISSR